MQMISPESGCTESEILDELTALAESIFSSFGETHVIEDAVKKMREHETHDSANKTFMVIRQMGTMIDDGALELHRRTQIIPPTCSGTAKSVPAGKFPAIWPQAKP